MRSPSALHLTTDLVARTLRTVTDEGPEPNWTPISSNQLDELVQRVDEEARDQEIWVFAYGSLMWNPGFDVAGFERAVAFGWHRAFALRIERLRATSDAPGLMLALQPGGSCTGLTSSLPARRRRKIYVGSWPAKSAMSKFAIWSVGSRSGHRQDPVAH